MWRIDSYIYFKYYNWRDIPNVQLWENFNIKILHILKELYEYDYKVFKTILFLYWDLELYLEGFDNIKNTLIVNKENFNFLSIKFNNKFRSNFDFVHLIKKRKAINLWENLENREMLYTILNYDIYTKTYFLDTMHKNNPKIKIYKKYKKNNDLTSINDIRQLQLSDMLIKPSYYDSFIDEWYKEWTSGLNKDLTQKYKGKILLLDIELKELVKKLDEYNA
jgi:hypothetical protein